MATNTTKMVSQLSVDEFKEIVGKIIPEWCKNIC